MIAIARAVVLALLLVSPPGLVSGSAASDDGTRISPDRPTVSNNTDTVPPRAIQIEAGLVYQQGFPAQPIDRRFALEGTLRVGLLESLEVRLFGEPFVALRGEDNASGQGVFGLSLKYRFLDAPDGSPWPALALQPFIIFPTAKDPIGSGRTDFGLIGIASADLPAALHVDANAGLVGVGQEAPKGYLLQGLVSAVLSWAALERLSLFGELFFFSPAERGGRGQLGLDAGLVYFVTNRLALDAAVFTTVAGAGPDFAIRAGFSVLFGR